MRSTECRSSIYIQMYKTAVYIHTRDMHKVMRRSQQQETLLSLTNRATPLCRLPKTRPYRTC